MGRSSLMCIKRGVDENCSSCGASNIIKSGRTCTGKQRFQCNECKHRFIKDYSYQAYEPETNNCIKELVKEGSGIRSIGRLLNISATTVQSRILKIAKHLKPADMVFGKKYEMDELCTYIGNKKKRIWVAYALRLDNKAVIGFKVGGRSKKTLRSVGDRLVLSTPKQINTDRLKEYKAIFPNEIHKTKNRGTNHIERMNTTLRCHLKRLNRKTICYSKSLALLNACLAIYFWG